MDTFIKLRGESHVLLVCGQTGWSWLLASNMLSTLLAISEVKGSKGLINPIARRATCLNQLPQSRTCFLPNTVVVKNMPGLETLIRFWTSFHKNLNFNNPARSFK
jgi:hypothetical protein